MSKIIMLSRMEMRQFEVGGGSGWLYRDIFETKLNNKENINNNYIRSIRGIYNNVFVEKEKFYISINMSNIHSDSYQIICLSEIYT